MGLAWWDAIPTGAQHLSSCCCKGEMQVDMTETVPQHSSLHNFGHEYPIVEALSEWII